MPEEQEESGGMEEPEINQNVLNMVLQMGIPEIPAKHAVYKTGNCDADAAVTWYFANMENPDIQAPLMVEKKASGAKKNDGPQIP